MLTNIKSVGRLPRRQAFTLIELLVVLVIVAIILLVGVLSLSGFNLGAKLKETAQQLKQVMTIASQQAILQPAVLGMKITDKGYRFYRLASTGAYGKTQWTALRDDQISRPKAFAAHVVVQVKTNTFKSDDPDDAQAPQIVFYSSGFVTPAIITVKADKAKVSSYKVNVFSNGMITVKIDADT
ncbi:MAG: type II secretion system minor pseudopilin GspH [Coxiellaceae bacterium]|nr:type II secretion system minor pseudopilin GspH [Coxiellaceae bacterium]